jgi:hypothetical protein
MGKPNLTKAIATNINGCIIFAVMFFWLYRDRQHQMNPGNG